MTTSLVLDIALDRDIWTNIYQEKLNINVHIRVYKAISYFLPSSESWIELTLHVEELLTSGSGAHITATLHLLYLMNRKQCIAYTLNMLTSDEAMSTVDGVVGRGGGIQRPAILTAYWTSITHYASNILSVPCPESKLLSWR